MHEPVVVTGAGGFVGSHCVKQLLEAGYTVRATVRNASSEQNAFLKELVPGSSDRLELWSADLTTPGSFDSVVVGATAVIHAAAAVMLTARDPQREIVDVTVDGTRNILEACAKAARIEGSVLRRFVLISSIAAIQDNTRPAGHVYTEADYNESATVGTDPYSVSKLQSEKLAGAFLESTLAPLGVTGAMINPGAIYGPILSPQHARSSPTIILDLMKGKIPMAPQLGFPSVDVRDVAAAAIDAAVTAPQLVGRFVCVEGTYTIKDLAALASQSFPLYKFPTWSLPNAFMYIGALFDKRVTVSFLRANLGQYRQFSAARLKAEAQWTPRPMADTIRDTCQSFVDLECVVRKS